MKKKDLSDNRLFLFIAMISGSSKKMIEKMYCNVVLYYIRLQPVLKIGVW